MEDRWLSVEDVCEYLGCSRETVYNWINERGMPANKVGRLWKFKKKDIDAWVRSGNAADEGEEPPKKARKR